VSVATATAAPTINARTQQRHERELLKEVAACYADPLRFVLTMFPWGHGTLQHHAGPDIWQTDFLRWLGEQVKQRRFNGMHPVRPIRRAVSKGHGVGGSTLAAFLVAWIMSTRAHAQGTVTANTHTQLNTKTWASVQRWMTLCLTSHWFEINSSRMYHRDHPASWFCTPQSCREENSEAFAGQHAESSTSFYMFDEASAIPEKIYEVAEGGLTDGEPMEFLFGNATRSYGKFHRACFGSERELWAPQIIDSRECRFTNKEQIAEWESLYGEDSDFFRVRVRGLPPRASDAQFIDMERILLAQKRDIATLPDEPLVAGCDLAWGGEDDNVIRFRRGADARSIPPIRIKGEFTRDPSVLVTRLADVLTQTYDGHKVGMLFLDSAGIAGPIGARLRELGFRNIQEVNFGADSPDVKCRYMRDYMWERMKQWLLTAAIDRSADLEMDLAGPGTRHDNRQRIWLESKKEMKARGLDSPDDADALALTFAAPVRAKSSDYAPPPPPPIMGERAWMCV
jgi:hypothetical protein